MTAHDLMSQVKQEENMNTYFSDANGMIACPKHIGMYAQQALAHKPDVKRIQTPITVWIKLSDAEVEQVKEWQPEVCESCHFGSKK
jgi:hypothetical protein